MDKKKQHLIMQRFRAKIRKMISEMRQAQERTADVEAEAYESAMSILEEAVVCFDPFAVSEDEEEPK